MENLTVKHDEAAGTIEIIAENTKIYLVLDEIAGVVHADGITGFSLRGHGEPSLIHDGRGIVYNKAQAILRIHRGNKR